MLPIVTSRQHSGTPSRPARLISSRSRSLSSEAERESIGSPSDRFALVSVVSLAAMPVCGRVCGSALGWGPSRSVRTDYARYRHLESGALLLGAPLARALFNRWGTAQNRTHRVPTVAQLSRTRPLNDESRPGAALSSPSWQKKEVAEA